MSGKEIWVYCPNFVNLLWLMFYVLTTTESITYNNVQTYIARETQRLLWSKFSSPQGGSLATTTDPHATQTALLLSRQHHAELGSQWSNRKRITHTPIHMPTWSILPWSQMLMACGTSGNDPLHLGILEWEVPMSPRTWSQTLFSFCFSERFLICRTWGAPPASVSWVQVQTCATAPSQTH